MRLEKGEVVALVGPSGVGKSTLLHLVAGLDKPGRGVIRVAGRSVAALKGAELDRYRSRTIGMVYQFHFLLPEFDALENVMMPAVIAGSRNGVRSRARKLLEDVGLKGRLHHSPAQLSGGEQQRVAIARALMNEPELMLADEPTGNLDEDTGDSVFDLLLALSRDRGLTVLVATHNSKLAQACRRIVRLEEGRVR